MIRWKPLQKSDQKRETLDAGFLLKVVGFKQTESKEKILSIL